jgi:transcriptional regulator with XRE-family HTH domain
MYNAEKIKEKMTEDKVTVQKLCQETGLSHDTIARIRKGDNVAIETLQKVTDVLGIEITELFVKAA